MDTFMGRYRNITILGAVIILQILGLAIQVKRPNELNVTGAGGRVRQDSQSESSRLIRVWAVTLIAPMEKAIVSLQSGTSDVWHNYFYLRRVRQENRQLRDQIEQLQLEQVRLKQDADQAHRLQALLGFKEQYIAKTTAAQVIGSSGSEQSRTIYIDKGSRDGIQTAMPVISAQGVVGKVIAVFKSTSQVLLINDQQSGAGAILEQSRLQGVLKGKASGEVVIDKIMPDEEVKPGDRVLTSGGDQIFPKGLPIGTVSKVLKGPEFLQVIVKPTTELSHLEEVLVIAERQEREAPVATASGVRAADILAQRLPSVPDKPAAAVTPNTGNSSPKTSPAGTTQPGTTASAPAQNKPQVSGPQVPAATKPQMNSSTPAKPAVTAVPKSSAAPPQTVQSTTTGVATNSPGGATSASRPAASGQGSDAGVTQRAVTGSTPKPMNALKAAGTTPASQATTTKVPAQVPSKPVANTTQVPANTPPNQSGDTPQ
jgi:rod shape-determining protein MreC